MKIEDIIESLNRHIEDKKNSKKLDTVLGHLVLQKTTTNNSIAKSFKVISYTLWFVNRDRKCRVLHIQHTCKLLEGQEEKVIRDIEIEFVEKIFNWIGSNFYEEVINGTYYEME